jgi:hypothetical protein
MLANEAAPTVAPHEHYCRKEHGPGLLLVGLRRSFVRGLDLLKLEQMSQVSWSRPSPRQRGVIKNVS